MIQTAARNCKFALFCLAPIKQAADMKLPGRAAPSSRRSFLRNLSLSIAAGSLVRPVRLGAQTPAASVNRFRFLVVNDIHHVSPECTPFMETLVLHMQEQGPVDFCLNVGDLADLGARESLVAVRDIFAALGAPVYPVPGNHDCDVGENTDLYSEIFPDRLNYSFAHRGWQFIGLDSTDGNKWNETRVGDAALSFLDTAARDLDRKAPTVLFTHFPMATDVRWASLSGADVLSRLDDLNLRCAFSGHFHARTERTHGRAAVLTNTCCSRVRGPHDDTTAEGYLVCTAHPDGRLDRVFIPYKPAEKQA